MGDTAYKTTASDTGWSNQITYSTPKFGGLSANIHYQFGEQAGKSGANNVGANLMYFSGPLALTAFYERADMLSNPTPSYTPGKKNNNWMLGGSYNFDIVKVYATYGQAEKDTAYIKSAEQKTYSFGVDVPVSKSGTVKFAYAQTKTEKVTALNTQRKTATVGYDHFLSKRTDAYAVAMYDKDDRFRALDKPVSGTSVAVGIRHRF